MITLVTGTLAKVPVSRTAKAGNTMATATLAVDAGGEKPAFLGLCAFGSEAETLLQLDRGDAVSVRGKLRLNRWVSAEGEQKERWEITADALLVGPGKPTRASMASRQGKGYGHPGASVSEFARTAILWRRGAVLMSVIASTNRPDSRRKGADGERELARVLADHLGVEITRNLMQAWQGGHDLNGLSVALEVKRYATTSPALVAKWWDQATRQATGTGLVPALAYRVDRQPWRFLVPLSLIVEGLPFDPGYTWAIETSLPAFCLIIRENGL